MTSHRPSLLRLGLVALAAAAGGALAGCNDHSRIVNDSYPQTHAQRHPIVLSEESTKLELPVGAGSRGLTDRQRDDIRAFAADWRKNGRGPVGLMIPTGGSGDWAAPAVRTALAGAGVPSTQIVSRRYSVARGEGPELVKLGYVTLKAGVPHPCGLWPDDLNYGGGDVYGQTENRDYWNFGCATQANFAAQVADPEDLARPRAMTPASATRRSAVMDKHRALEDTTSNYRQQDATVSDIGGK